MSTEPSIEDHLQRAAEKLKEGTAPETDSNLTDEEKKERGEILAELALEVQDIRGRYLAYR
jgi:hypothetical protein